MPTEVLLLTYGALIVIASMTGGWLPVLMQMTHLRTQLLMSFVAGLMLAIAMLHLLPHAAEALGSSSKAGAAALFGVLAMFLLMRLFHAHDHTVAEVPDAVASRLIGAPVSAARCSHGHDHDHEHSHEHDHADHQHGGHADEHAAVHRHGGNEFGWLGMMFGLGLHTLVDGVALAASVVADGAHGSWLGLAGIGTFLAVALHKPLDAFAITSVMQKEGWSARGRSLANFAFSLACPIGAFLFYVGATDHTAGPQWLGWGLAVSAGFFICIALADLLPEVAFHDHDRVKLTAALLLGIALAVGIENLPGHSHDGHLHHPGEVGHPAGSPDH
ncbi:MAG: ZIP family metal transporter [Planctomycetaceae bacterium]